MKKKKNKMYFPPYDMSDTIEFEFQQSTEIGRAHV